MYIPLKKKYVTPEKEQMQPFTGELDRSHKLVMLASLETNVSVISQEKDRQIICEKMCEMANTEGVDIINNTNNNLCSTCPLLKDSIQQKEKSSKSS